MVTAPPTVGVKTPEVVIVPLVADQLTAELKLPVPWTVAEQVDAVLVPKMRIVGEQVTVTDVIVGGRVTITVDDPDLVASWVDVAVMVAEPEAGTVAGAV